MKTSPDGPEACIPLVSSRPIFRDPRLIKPLCLRGHNPAPQKAVEAQLQIEQMIEFTGAIGEFGLPGALIQNVKSQESFGFGQPYPERHGLIRTEFPAATLAYTAIPNALDRRRAKVLCLRRHQKPP